MESQPEGVTLAAELGLPTSCFGVERFRVEPVQSEFSRATPDPYRRLAAARRDTGLGVVVTFDPDDRSLRKSS
ncbi:hypothetical protein [Streptomyces sp. NPDC091215]|uniref:hypothetical protein n=1 Tax=Streptomyces sp. NPDC091215 TaxID=3155192 RepID=UPI0034354BC1